MDTQHSYLSHLRHFLRDVGLATRIEALTPELLAAYCAHEDARVRPRSACQMHFALRSFCCYLVARGLLPADPTQGIKRPPLDPERREVPTDRQVAAIVAACEQLVPSARVQARAILLVLVHVGLRRKETLGLRISDIDLLGKSVCVRNPKGGPRSDAPVVYLTDEAADALARHLAARPKDLRHDYLFWTDRSRRFGHDSLQALIEQLASIARIDPYDCVKPHGLRHYFAVSLARTEGVNLIDVRDALRHKRVATTEKYLRKDAGRMKSVAALLKLPPPPPGPAGPDPAPSPVESPLERPNLRLWREGGELA